jgi:hypothetical protein
MKITLISVYENFKIGHAFGIMATCQHCSFLSNFLIHKTSQEIDYLPHQMRWLQDKYWMIIYIVYNIVNMFVFVYVYLVKIY